MRRLGLQILLAAGLSGALAADETRVHATATVEVLDDKTPIEDVISRMRNEPRAKDQAAKTTLKELRPVLPTNVEPMRRLNQEPKAQPPGARRPNHERNGNPDHLERTHRHK